MTQDELRDVLLKHGGVTQAAEAIGMTRGKLRGLLAQLKADELMGLVEVDGVRDREVLEHSVNAHKRLQRFADVNRVERKAFREHARIENAVSGLAAELRDILKGHAFKSPPQAPPKAGKGRPGMIIHWSDQHLNERVELAHNRYDWQVAARRLRKHVHECLRLARAYDVEHVFVAMTGDLLNSDRRLDELMANAGNRAKACVLAVDLYQQALRELAEHVRVTVGSVSGNESRIPKDVGWNAEVASDNYDFMIHEQLSLLLDDHGGIEMLPVHDPGELLVTIAGQNCLFIHGHGAIDRDVQKAVQAAKGRWLSRGMPVNFIFWGHVHEALVADGYARNSSLVGTNDYAEKALNYTGRASQNAYIVLPDGGFHGFKFDLQNADGVQGYEITKRLEAYNTKSAAKLRPEHTVVRVVI